jgi:hypothetical protein
MSSIYLWSYTYFLIVSFFDDILEHNLILMMKNIFMTL